jgi:hypothetical protein
MKQATHLTRPSSMHAAVGDLQHAAFFDGHVFAAFLRVLDHAVSSAEHTKHVLHGCAQSGHHLRDVEMIPWRELRFFQNDDV